VQHHESTTALQSRFSVPSSRDVVACSCTRRDVVSRRLVVSYETSRVSSGARPPRGGSRAPTRQSVPGSPVCASRPEIAEVNGRGRRVTRGNRGNTPTRCCFVTKQNPVDSDFGWCSCAAHRLTTRDTSESADASRSYACLHVCAVSLGHQRPMHAKRSYGNRPSFAPDRRPATWSTTTEYTCGPANAKNQTVISHV